MTLAGTNVKPHFSYKRTITSLSGTDILTDGSTAGVNITFSAPVK